MKSFRDQFDFSKPVCVAAGPWNPPHDVSNLGAWFTKTVTLEPRVGNEDPTVLKLPGGGYLNRIGLKNDGLDAFLATGVNPSIPTFVSIWADDLKDWAELAISGRVQFGLELNLSCPNVSAQHRSHTGYVKKAVEAVRSETDAPLVVKLAPDPDRVVEWARAARQGGADALTISNSLKTTHFDGVDYVEGGLSGTPLKPVSLRCVRLVAEVSPLPIFGCGGIRTAGDARLYLDAGASAVQVGSAHLDDPDASAKIAEGLVGHKV